MNVLKIIAILLIVVGILGLLYGGVTQTRTSQGARVGRFKVSVTDQQTTGIPIWAAVGAIVIGGALLFVRRNQ